MMQRLRVFWLLLHFGWSVRKAWRDSRAHG